jgi:shikimate kinase
MRGVGEATAAITVVNALPTGIGAALGIALRARAEVEIRTGGTPPPPPAVEPSSARTPLVEASLRDALAQFHPGTAPTARLALSSEIPPAVGLKSSSAVQSAIVLAVAHSAGSSITPLDVARSAARVARTIGASATGAFDDALAGLVSGVVLTDNGRDVLIRHDRLGPDLEAALWIPPGAHPPSPTVRDRFAELASLATPSVDAALGGDWASAMELNSELVEQVMGYRYAELRSAVRRRGAVASGVSGLGPAFAVVAPSERLPQVVAELPASSGRVLRARVASGRSDPEALR